MISPDIVKEIKRIRASAHGCTYESAYHILNRAIELALGAIEQETFDLQEKK